MSVIARCFLLVLAPALVLPAHADELLAAGKIDEAEADFKKYEELNGQTVP